MPKLSIITINLNNETGLQKTIESVVSQNFNDYEHIIIDGGSSDGSINVIKEHADKITHWVSERDKGIYNAMNKGILKASGKYLLFLNSGDWLADRHVLSKVFAKGSDADILYGEIVFWSGNDQQQLWNLKNQAIDLQHMYKSTIPHPSAFIKRTLFDNELYDEKYTIVSDWKFFIKKIVIENVSIFFLDQVVAYVNTFGVSSDVKNKELIKQERNDVLHELFQPLILSNIEECYELKNSPLASITISLSNNKPLKALTYRFVALMYWMNKKFFLRSNMP